MELFLLVRRITIEVDQYLTPWAPRGSIRLGVYVRVRATG